MSEPTSEEIETQKRQKLFENSRIIEDLLGVAIAHHSVSKILTRAQARSEIKAIESRYKEYSTDLMVSNFMLIADTTVKKKDPAEVTGTFDLDKSQECHTFRRKVTSGEDDSIPAEVKTVGEK